MQKTDIIEVQRSLAVAMNWFCGEVNMWREITGGRISEDGMTESICFDRDDDKNLDSFIAVLNACERRLIEIAANGE